MDASDGDVRVVSVPLENPSDVPPEALVTWPLDQDLVEFAIEPYYFEADSGLVVNDPDDVAALRQLRDEYQMLDYYPLTAEASDGTFYSFWIRDELPEAVSDSLAELRARH